AALAGPVTALQLRAKRMGGREMFDLARMLQSRCRPTGVLFFVNDRVDIAMTAGADGVHVGMHDLPLETTRQLIGQGMVLGFSPLEMADVIAAKGGGADYVGLGPVFGTASKVDAQPPLGLAALAGQVHAANLPAVGIGGITIANAAEVIRAGADGVAVISAIQGAPDAKQAAESLVSTVNQAKSER
ncbi:MAG: thiamine phosphate synthase, partial [Thermomicrobiales bacterium]